MTLEEECAAAWEQIEHDPHVCDMLRRGQRFNAIYHPPFEIAPPAEKPSPYEAMPVSVFTFELEHGELEYVRVVRVVGRLGSQTWPMSKWERLLP